MVLVLKANEILASRSLKKIGKGCFTFDTVSGILSEIFCPNGYLPKLELITKISVKLPKARNF